MLTDQSDTCRKISAAIQFRSAMTIKHGYLLVIMLYGCSHVDRPRQSETHTPQATIEHINPQSLIDVESRNIIVSRGISVLPDLFISLQEANGLESKNYNDYERFYLQFTIKQIIREDYITKHPNITAVSWAESDHGKILLEWWNNFHINVMVLMDYNLPICCEAIK